MYYIIRTKYNYYVVNEKMEITQLKQKPLSEHAFSGKWRVRGIREIKPFNHLGGLIPLDYAVQVIPENSFTFKNGKGKYVVEDVDHGTSRIWGNQNILSIWTTEGD